MITLPFGFLAARRSLRRPWRRDPHNTDLFVAAKAGARWPDQRWFAGIVALMRARSHGPSLLYLWATLELRSLAQSAKRVCFSRTSHLERIRLARTHDHGGAVALFAF